MSHAEVIEDVTPLSRRVWRFFYHTQKHALVCSYYAYEERASKRHKFKATEEYNAYYRRRNSENPPPIPDGVKAAAMRDFTERLTVQHFDESGR